MDKPKSKRGGAGRGQGAKTADGVAGVKRYNVTLDAATDAAALRLGNGNRSVGIRRALAIYSQPSGTCGVEDPRLVSRNPAPNATQPMVPSSPTVVVKISS